MEKGETYTAINVQERQRIQKPLLILFGLLLIVAAIAQRHLAFGLFGAALLFLAGYRKVTTADESGITTWFHYLIFHTNLTYPFRELSDLVVDTGPQETLIAFVRNGVTTYALFDSKEAEQIVKWADQTNDRIHIAYRRMKSAKRSL